MSIKKKISYSISFIFLLIAGLLYTNIISISWFLAEGTYQPGWSVIGVGMDVLVLVALFGIAGLTLLIWSILDNSN